MIQFPSGSVFNPHDPAQVEDFRLMMHDLVSRGYIIGNIKIP